MAHNFSARNFRDTVGIPAVTDSTDDDGVPTRTWSPTSSDWTSCTCRVEFINPTGMSAHREGSPAAFGQTDAVLIFKGRPSAEIGVDTPIYHTAGGGGTIDPPDLYIATAPLMDRGLGTYHTTMTRRA